MKGGNMQAMSVTNAARELGISRMTVLRLYHAGELRGYRTTTASGAHIRLDTESVAQFKSKQRQEQQTAKDE